MTNLPALSITQGREHIHIAPWGPDSLRVRVRVGGPVRDDLPQALLPPDDPGPVDIKGRTIRAGRIAAEVSPGGEIRFLDADGAELLAEAAPHFIWPPARQFTAHGDDDYHLAADFRAYDDERLYGLGQHQHGRLDQKGCVIDLVQRNTEISIPFLLSSRGYGFLWNNPAIGRVELAHNRTRWVAERSGQLDYWITAGPDPAAILDNYARATGYPAPFPAWAAGFWQCKLRYRNQDELLAVAREYRARDLPLDVIVIDFMHWPHLGDWQLDPVAWPDPAALVAELAALDVKLMVSVWPAVNAASPNFAVLLDEGLLVGTERGQPALWRFVDANSDDPVYLHHIDSTNPAARQFLWARIREGYYQHGIRVWWLDANEPELYPHHPDHLRYHAGNGARVGNLYPLHHIQAFYEGMRAEGETEIVSLCRSAWAGAQRYGAALWSGDVASSFAALRVQVRAGLNMALSGIPWWTTDIGGFHGGDPADPAFRELLVRWFQYAVFCPICRLHGFRAPTSNWTDTGGPNEVWSFGEEVYALLRDLLFLRERLRPYLMAQMAHASQTGLPPMRPLLVDFPDDPLAWDVEDQFMLGPDLLVAPVLAAGARQRSVYLPAGAAWRAGERRAAGAGEVAPTGPIFDGGQTITVDAPLDTIPVFVRDGAEKPF